MVGGVRLRSLLPKDTSRFYRYSGSLTTPKCFETVTWTIFEEPQKISARQLARLRDLLHEDGHYSDVTNDPKSGSVGGAHNAHNYLVDNWRPLQALHSRIIKQSFPFASPRTGHETVTKDAGLAFTSEPALPTPVAVPAPTPPPVSSSPLPMPSSSLLVASSPTPEASPMVQLTTTTDAGPNPSPYTYRNTNPEGVADPSLEFLTSGNKQGAPPTVPSFKSMTEFNNTKGQNTVLSGAARIMPGNGQQHSVQSTGSKDQLQAVDSNLMERPPLPVEDHTQNSSTTVLDVPGASAGRQQGLGSGSNTQLPTSVDITSNAQPSSSVGHPALHPLEPQPPSSTDVSTTLVPSEQHPSTAGAPSPSAEESTTRNPSQPFAGVSSPNQDNGQQIANQERGNATSTSTGQSVDTQASTPVVERVSSPQSASAAHRMNHETSEPAVHNTSEITNQTTTQERGNATSTHTGQSVDTQASTPVVANVDIQKLASLLRQMLVEKQRLALNTTSSSSSSTPLTGRGSTLPPAFDVNNQHRAWQQQQRQMQFQAREQQIRQQRINQILLKQRRLMQQQQGLSGARTQQSTRNVYSSTPAGVRRGSISASPQPSSNPLTLSQALGSLRSTFYRDATTNHITSGSARVRSLARTINPGAHSVGIRPQLVPAYRLQGEKTALPSVGASRATPYVFLHTNNRTIRIRRPFYENMYQTPRQ
ncbi:uncharacterized protein [Littorina saxatilis]|uniref:carbonic anhydrase n=1 Tax=Littorina saxatilis TaxID=31220 RepID=A0AAN9AIJ4_9CAEN